LTQADSVYFVDGATVTVCVHWALSWPAGVPMSEAAPECA
jgi:hypothetical protein